MPAPDQPTATTLLRTTILSVRRDGGRIVIRRRSADLWLGTLLIGCVGLVFLGLWRLGLHYDWPVLGAVGLWGGIIVFAAASLLPLKAIWILFEPATVFDAGAKALRVGRRAYRFESVTTPRLERVLLANLELLALYVDADGAPLRLIQGASPKQERELAQVLTAIQDMLKIAPAKRSADVRTNEAASRIESRQVVIAILLALGALWSVAGYFALPDFVFGKSGSDFGFLIWPLGIWIAALGVLEAVGVPVFRFGSAGPLWRRALFVVLWLGPYFAICYRPL